ncbi:MAG: RlmE family RNA methyltransferase [Proteobacteria bacterium]|nr:RlmE family RNA methyltransferase [Pseudomonadota bacterium]
MGGPRRTADHYSKKARAERYPARSIYKLEEIDKRVRLLKPGFKVLDLGAAPGSWTLYASQKVGPSGRVVAVDRAALTVGTPPNTVYVQADALAIDPAALLAAAGVKGGFDAVISDMAPRTSGHRFVDQSRSFELFCRAVAIAAELCRPGGSFVGKIFQGEEFETARGKVRELFEECRVVRPASVRSESYEIYLVGLRRK